MRLILVRHGQTTSNVHHLLDTGAPGASLTELGHAQAAALPGALAGHRVGAVFVSTLVRTHETAAPLAAELGLRVAAREGIREVSAGRLEMLGDEESLMTYYATVETWIGGETGARMPGGESGHEVLERYDEVVVEAASLGEESVVLISHGAAIRYWAGERARSVDPALAAQPLQNTGVVVLEGDPEAGWRAVSWGGPTGP